MTTCDTIVVEFNDRPGKYGLDPDSRTQDKQLEDYEKKGYEIDYDACRVKFKEEVVETCKGERDLRRVTYYTFVLVKDKDTNKM